MKNELILKDEDVKYFLYAVKFMADVTNKDLTFVDVFTDEEIKGFKVMLKILFPLIQKIHEVGVEVSK